MTMRWLRLSVSLVLIWIVPAFVTITTASWWGRLPAEIPSQWDSTGKVTGSTPLWLLVTIVLVGCVVAAVVATTGAIGSESFRATWIAAGMGAMLAGIWLFLAMASLDQPTLGGVSPWALLTPLLVTYGLLPAMIAPSRPAPSPTTETRLREEVTLPQLGAKQTAVSITVVFSRLLVALSVVALAGAGGFLVRGVTGELAAPVSWGAGLTLIVVGLAVLGFAGVRVMISRAGVQVRSAALGFALRTIPLTEIADAETSTIDSARWGGLGYRVGSSGTAIVVKTGPALRVGLADGRAFLVSHSRPEEAVALLGKFLTPAERT